MDSTEKDIIKTIDSYIENLDYKVSENKFLIPFPADLLTIITQKLDKKKNFDDVLTSELTSLSRSLNKINCLKLKGPKKIAGSLNLSWLGEVKRLSLETLEWKEVENLMTRGLTHLSLHKNSLSSLRDFINLKCNKKEEGLEEEEEEGKEEVKRKKGRVSRNWSRLEVVSLRWNLFKQFIFPQEWKNVRILDLSHNQIFSLYNLQNLKHIEVLILDCNNLTNLTFLPFSTSLSSLSISFNLLLSLEGIEKVPGVKRLDISENLLHSYSQINPLTHLQSLNHLKISGNPICGEKSFSKIIRKCFNFQVQNKIKINKNFKLINPLEELPEANVLIDKKNERDGRKDDEEEKKKIIGKEIEEKEDFVVVSVKSKNKKPRIVNRIPTADFFDDDYEEEICEKYLESSYNFPRSSSQTSPSTYPPLFHLNPHPQTSSSSKVSSPLLSLSPASNTDTSPLLASISEVKLPVKTSVVLLEEPTTERKVEKLEKRVRKRMKVEEEELIKPEDAFYSNFWEEEEDEFVVSVDKNVLNLEDGKFYSVKVLHPIFPASSTSSFSSFTSYSASSFSCCLIGHWMCLVENEKEVREKFDLRGLKKISAPYDSSPSTPSTPSTLLLLFATLNPLTKKLIIQVLEPPEVVSELKDVLNKFMEFKIKPMLECLKCGKVFEDLKQPLDLSKVSMPTDVNTKTKIAYSNMNKKPSCPKCLSEMVVRKEGDLARDALSKLRKDEELGREISSRHTPLQWNPFKQFIKGLTDN